MAEIKGLTGLKPTAESVNLITCPPYDVIKPQTKLESILKENLASLYHITLGKDPLGALERLIKENILVEDQSPCFYVYEQQYNQQVRTGVLTATQVTDYAQGEIIRHEKTFDDKVKGRLALRAQTGYTFEPVFLLTKSPIGKLLEEIKSTYQPEYEFTSDFQEESELHGIKNRIFRVAEQSREGILLQKLVAQNPLYIADGHHRYHASLLNRQTNCLAYICEAAETKIQAYNRVINGLVPFSTIKNKLNLKEVSEFKTPPKHFFRIYTQKGTYELKAQNIPDDVIGRLDCNILEKELYPHLGLTHEMIMDTKHFDYYAEADLAQMIACVNEGKYDLAVALHPVSIAELLDVADTGIKDSQIVMPEKSTFFAPKILSGLFIYKHVKNSQ